MDNKDLTKQRLLRCVNWLTDQNLPDKPKIEPLDLPSPCNLREDESGDDISEDTTIKAAGELNVKPMKVPIHKLRLENLHLQCEWQGCDFYTSNYDTFQKHIRTHIPNVHVIQLEGTTEYVCLWDICGHKTADMSEMIRHINYHAYHAKLLAIGFNARATLDLVRCKKDSSKRNLLPKLLSKHQCLWYECGLAFDSIQMLYDHVRQHVNYSEQNKCYWGGCSTKFPRKTTLIMHSRSHTGEKLIACAHCGTRFANNRKLCDHLKKQNAEPSLGHICTICGIPCATEYLLREHSRRHVSVFACTMCDMTAPTRSSLAVHVSYRHLPVDPVTRPHKCPHCEYRSVTKWDLRKHVNRHSKLPTKSKKQLKTELILPDEIEENKVEKRKYICHMCPKKEYKVFCHGKSLTVHLVKVHGVRWPFGHSKFRYQLSQDGYYRLITTRYESLEVSKKIVDGNVQTHSIENTLNININKISDITEESPTHYNVTLGNCKVEDNKRDIVEITMCDMDDKGNIVVSEVIKSDVCYADDNIFKGDVKIERN